MANHKTLLDLAFDERFPEASNQSDSQQNSRVRNRTRCTVWRPKKYPPFFVLAGEPHKKEDSHTNYHEWQDGYCIHCHKTVEETLTPKPPKKLRRRKDA